jgi:hypothetical protein
VHLLYGDAYGHDKCSTRLRYGALKILEGHLKDT